MDVDVLVVGGGPVGLVAAGQLGRSGVRTLLVEPRTRPVAHPRARSINVRTGEIFRAWGIEGDVRAVSLPVEWGSQMVFTRTLAGEEIGRLPMRTHGTRDGVEHSPCDWLLSSQDRLEPVLRRHLDRHPSVRQLWGWELVDLQQDATPTDRGGAATVTLRPAGDGERQQVRARWVVAADGAASTVRKLLGVPMVGRHGLGSLVNTQFHADLGPWTDHRPAALYWTTAPATNVFQKIEGDRWLCQISAGGRGEDRPDLRPDEAADWIRRSVGVPELSVRVVDTIPWSVSCTVAERLRVGRVLLVGDAAHQLPPSGGFGMNTGIQDAHGLAWKLAGVVGGWAGEALLDTHHVERAPVARFNAERSLDNGRAVHHIRRIAEGARPDIEGDAGLSLVRRYTGFLGMDLGVAYGEGAVVPDGTPAPVVDDPVVDHVPVARPGHRAPHHRLRLDGRPISTLDLFDSRFVLLAGPAGRAWREAAAAVAAPLAVLVVGEDVEDADGGWADAYGVEGDGAVLVRPDGVVGARWRRGGAGCAARCADAIAHITRRR